MKVKALQRLPSGLFILTDEEGLLFEEPLTFVSHETTYPEDGPIRVEEVDVQIERLKPISEKPDEGT